MVRAIRDGVVLPESDQTIGVEGNYYCLLTPYIGTTS